MADRPADGSAAPSGEAAGLRPRQFALPRLAVPVSSGVLAAAAFATAAIAIFFVHWPVLSHYFFGDDFVPLADIETRTTWGYVKNLFLLQDETPNWRVLPGLFYLAAYKSFGLNAFPFLLANVAVHIGTGVLIFWFVRRTTDKTWPAFLAALFFGLTPAYVPTVGQVTAFNNVLAGFLVMASVVALHEGIIRGELPWRLLSALLFAAAIAANESVAVLAPVLVLVIVWREADAARGPWDRNQLARLTLLSAPYVLIGGAALAGFGACRCTEAADETLFSAGDHVSENFWLYLGRLLYPVGMEAPGETATAHSVAGGVAVALAAFAIVRGPQLARWAVVFLLLALVPYLPLELWSAPRYTYMAAIPFAILAALLFADAAQYGERWRPFLPGLVALVAFGVMGLYGWQTWNQNQVIASESTRWHDLVVDLQDQHKTLPAGSTVYVHGAAPPLNNPFLQCQVAPAVGQVLWGDAKLFTNLWQADWIFRIRPGYPVFVLSYAGGSLEPLDIQTAKPSDAQFEELIYLPGVDPAATGNLCRSNVPTLP
ncbi:MAG: hypothetical protein U1B78_02670 [Dehalococcoidia bacterium]|nr:hypothetical protein [Dehalococcoidia bacterium]